MTEPTTSWRELIKVHPAADTFPMMSPEELQVMANDMLANGLDLSSFPLKMHTDETGTLSLLDGRNRLDAMELAGYTFNLYEDMLLATRPDGTPEPLGVQHGVGSDPETLVIRANLTRRHLSTKDRQRIAKELLKTNPARSNRAIAKEAGVSHPTVAAIRDAVEASTGKSFQSETDQPEPEPAKRVGRDGKARKMPTKRVHELDAMPLEKRAAELTAMSTDEREAYEAKSQKIASRDATSNTALGQLKELWRQLTKEDKYEALHWLHGHEDALYHEVCKNAFKTAEYQRVAAGIREAEFPAGTEQVDPEPETPPLDTADAKVDAEQDQRDIAQDESAAPELSVQLGARVSKIVAKFQALAPNRQHWVLDRLDKPEDTINHIKKNAGWADVHDLLTAYIASSATEQSAFRAQVEPAQVAA